MNNKTLTSKEYNDKIKTRDLIRILEQDAINNEIYVLLCDFFQRNELLNHIDRAVVIFNRAFGMRDIFIAENFPEQKIGGVRNFFEAMKPRKHYRTLEEITNTYHPLDDMEHLCYAVIYIELLRQKAKHPKFIRVIPKLKSKLDTYPKVSTHFEPLFIKVEAEVAFSPDSQLAVLRQQIIKLEDENAHLKKEVDAIRESEREQEELDHKKKRTMKCTMDLILLLLRQCSVEPQKGNKSTIASLISYLTNYEFEKIRKRLSNTERLTKYHREEAEKINNFLSDLNISESIEYFDSI